MSPYVFDAKVECGYIEEGDESTDYTSDEDLSLLLDVGFGDGGVQNSEDSEDTVIEIGCCFFSDSKDGNV